MSKPHVTVFLCTGKDCMRAWHRVCDGSPAKWLKRQAEAAELPCKLDLVKTECMDRCDAAATVCCAHDCHAAWVDQIHSGHDATRLLTALRSCLNSSGE